MSVEKLVQWVRKGNVGKVKGLVSLYAPEDLGQALRAAIVHNQSECVDVLAPLVAASTQEDPKGLTAIDYAFFTTITDGNVSAFKRILPCIDFKKSTNFLLFACQFQRSTMAQHLIPHSNLDEVWDKLVSQRASKEELDVIRAPYEALQQNKLLQNAVDRPAPSNPRKL